MNGRQEKKHKVYMQIARDIAELSTCDRAHVGAIAVKNGRMVGHGVNGAPAGFEHCDSAGHLMIEGHCLRSVHSEANLVAHSDRKDMDGSTIYVTHSPCMSCFMLLANAGVNEIYFGEKYREDRFEMKKEFADENGIALRQFEDLIDEC